MRKYFLEDFCQSGKKIRYKDSIGKYIRFVYDDIQGVFLVKNSNDKSILIEYNGQEYWLRKSTMFRNYFPFLDDKDKKRLVKILYKYEIGEVLKNNKRDLIIVNRFVESKGKKHFKFYDFQCNKCGKISHHKPEENLFYSEVGCKCQAGNSVVKGINDIATTDSWMIPFLKNKNDAYLFSSQSHTKVEVVCPDCGREKVIHLPNFKKRKTISCSCGDGLSYPEKFMISFLDQSNISYDYQKTFPWCKFYNPYKRRWTTGRYDFYIEQYGLIIEADGAFHNKDNGLSGQSKDESIFIDKQKDELATEHNLKIVRLECSVSSMEHIKNAITGSDIDKYINVSLVDFEKCNLFAISNLRKKVIDEYNNTNFTARDLSKKYGMHESCIGTWLKQEGIDTKSKQKAILKDVNSKPVKISIDGVNCRFYDSLKSLATNFVQDFGETACYSYMIECINKGRSYKGYTIEYLQ